MADGHDAGVSDDVVMELVEGRVSRNNSKTQMQAQKHYPCGFQPNPRGANVTPIRPEQGQNAVCAVGLSHATSDGQGHEKAVTQRHDQDGDFADEFRAGGRDDEDDRAANAQTEGQLALKMTQSGGKINFIDFFDGSVCKIIKSILIRC